MTGELSAEERVQMRKDAEGTIRLHPARFEGRHIWPAAVLGDHVLALLDALDAAEARVAAVEAERDRYKAILGDAMREARKAYVRAEAAEADRDSRHDAWAAAVKQAHAAERRAEKAEAEVARLTAERERLRRCAEDAESRERQWKRRMEAAEAEVARLTAERHDLRSRLACVLEASYWDQGYDVRISHIRGMCDLSTNGLTATDDGERTAADLLAENRRLSALVEAGLALADEFATPVNECGDHQDEDEFGSKHYPSAGWMYCDGCSAAESADRERAALAARLRAALGGTA